MAEERENKDPKREHISSLLTGDTCAYMTLVTRGAMQKTKWSDPPRFFQHCDPTTIVFLQMQDTSHIWTHVYVVPARPARPSDVILKQEVSDPADCKKGHHFNWTEPSLTLTSGFGQENERIHTNEATNCQRCHKFFVVLQIMSFFSLLVFSTLLCSCG